MYLSSKNTSIVTKQKQFRKMVNFKEKMAAILNFESASKIFFQKAQLDPR